MTKKDPIIAKEFANANRRYEKQRRKTGVDDYRAFMISEIIERLHRETTDDITVSLVYETAVCLTKGATQ